LMTLTLRIQCGILLFLALTSLHMIRLYKVRF
jgi:hypothetical protein